MLAFSLSSEAVSQISEALICLAKFSESVSLEARQDKLTLTALNISKTAYAAFTLDSKAFFTSYAYRPTSSVRNDDRFTGQLYNRALQCAFKARAGDPRARDNLLERCDVSVQDSSDKVECRLIVKLRYKHGMTKSHRLTYEPVQIMHALFDYTAASQGWRIQTRIMREYIEYFGPKTEQLDLLAQDGKAVFTSFTEKIANGREVLKQPLETIITLHKEDFDDFHMREGMHIVISVKDFKAIVTHAESFHGTLKAAFSTPLKPLQLSYEGSGMTCEFTLMTTGDRQENGSSESISFVSTRSNDQQLLSNDHRPSANRAAIAMPPPSRALEKQHLGQSLGSQSHNRLRPSLTNTQAREEAETEPESLFVPLDDDTAWDTPNYDDDGQEEQLGYDASYSNERSAPHPTFRDSGSKARPSRQISLLSKQQSGDGLEPTQRLSQLHGMFD